MEQLPDQIKMSVQSVAESVAQSDQMLDNDDYLSSRRSSPSRSFDSRRSSCSFNSTSSSTDLTYIPFLPTEIIIDIVDHFRLPVLAYGHKVPPADYLILRTTLRNLCLSSVRFCSCAKPLLYETVIFYFGLGPIDVQLGNAYGNIVNLVLLIRTLITNPYSPGLIKNIICPVEIFGSVPWPSEPDSLEDLR